MKSEFIWHQGKLVPFQEATLHFLTPSLHYGTSIFEGIRSYKTQNGSAIFRLEDHIQRLINSMNIMGVRNFKYSKEDMMNACKDVVRENQLGDSYIRPLIYGIDGGWNLLTNHMTFEYSVAAWKWDKYMGEEALLNGIRAKISSFNRLHINSAMTKAKISGHYVNSVLARSEVMNSGYEEAILLDTQGFVSECSGQNLFAVRNGIVFTPGNSTILEGITRDTVFKICDDLKINYKENQLTRDHLYISDELFMVGTANEVVAINSVDDRLIGSGKMGPIAKQIMIKYNEVVKGESLEDYQWLSYIEAPKKRKRA